MYEIVKRVMAKISKNATMDEIKNVLSLECREATFEINSRDYSDMLDLIILALN